MTTQLALKMLAALAVAAVVSFLTTPMVKSLAYKVGAIDVPSAVHAQVRAQSAFLVAPIVLALLREVRRSSRW